MSGHLDEAIQYEPVDLDKASMKWAVLLYGSWGQWKTTTGCSLTYERGLLISADNSWKVLTKPEHKEIHDKIQLVEYKGLSQFDYIDYSGYDTVILDPVSEMTDEYVDLLLEHATWRGNQRDKIQSRDARFKDIEVPAPTDYRVVRSQFLPVIKKLFELPVNLVFIAHVNKPMDLGPGSDMTLRPAMPFGVYSIIARNTDAIGYMKATRNGCNVIVDEGSPICDAKSRITGLKGTVPVSEFVSKVRNWNRG